MQDTAGRAIAIVGVSAILPDAPDAASFWRNVKDGRYSIGEVPPERWDPALYYDADPSVPDKTYSKIGGWVRQWDWEPMKWRLPIPPKVADAMDDGQKWAVACARSALLDYGEDRPLDRERTAVVIGNALAGEKHYLTALRIFLPEYAAALSASPSFASLDPQARERIAREMHDQIAGRFAESTEDTMPGELANCMAGRIANLFDFRGPNFVCDAACAAALAALDAAVEGLVEQEYDAALVGGVDRNMGAPAFVKFCKIGALSATGTRPYADGADGFVMGEGAAFFLLKRLEDAEAAGDRIYAVVRGVGGSSDGKGKGITAPNPVGQRLAIERAWRNAGLSPASVGLVEGHGTSTRVGDVVEVQSLTEVFGRAGLAPGSVPLGSVKSNIGHLKGAAGAAGLLKTIFALHEKVLPPSLNFERPNPNIDFAHSPFYVNTDLKPWDPPADGVRRAGVSAFGFGGTNFHAVLEEYVPGRLARRTAQADVPGRVAAATRDVAQARAPRRGALVLGAPDVAALSERLAAVEREARAGRAPETQAPTQADLRAPERLAIDYGDAAELATRAGRAARALAGDEPAAWKALRAQGVFRGSGHPTPVAFLYTGQGSQYVNMLRELREHEPVVAETFDEADRVLRPLLDRPLTDYVFADPTDAEACARAEEALKRTEITQPAVLTVDVALTRLFAAHGIEPDMVMGHSLGEYGALVASGALPFADALEAVSARGGEMARLTTEDNGRMAAVLGPLEQIERVLEGVDGYVVIANLNSTSQAVIGGASEAVERAMRACADAGLQAVPLPVSHAFHTAIVAPASEPLRRTLERLHLAPPGIPLVANLNGDFYPMDTNAVPRMLDLLAAQVSSPVQFVKGLETLYASGARAFVEVGPKKALHGFVEDVLGAREGVLPLFANHPKVGDLASFNQALCGLYAAGRGVARDAATTRQAPVPREVSPATAAPTAAPAAVGALPADRVEELGRLFAEFLERGWRVYRGDGEAPAASEAPVVTGAALGLPGAARVFDDDHVQRILDGEQGIDVIPARFRNAMVEKHITRLVKSADGPHFETIEHPTEVIKLAARAGAFDLEREFGVDRERIAAFDVTTRLAVAAGLEALRDAGIPLVMRYRTTHKGTRIPERWVLPEGLRDETGVIFASAFPGFDAFARELTRQQTEHGLHQQIEALESLLARVVEEADGHDVLRDEIERRLHELRARLEHEPYVFDRRFLFRVLPMAHAQLAELIGARGPNTHVNSACASTTQAFALAEDWIRAGRCRRVVVVAADDVTTDDLLEWFASGFLATGAAATDDVVEEAALPFDRRRHGMILGMGAAGAVVESPACARERGLRPICQVLSTVTANSAFHGTRLDVDHIQRAMEQLVAQAERRFGLDRRAMAREMVFVSHETYTPARGGSAAAEVHALRQVFGPDADHVVVANTKGFTGHPMGVGIEDVVAIKALETGVVPPVPNYREPDPDLGRLHLSRGGAYPIRYALRLGAGFGSQISFSLLRWVPGPDGARPSPDELGYAARIRDAGAWSAWLRTLSGDASPELEVVNRTLRLKDRGAPASEPAPEVRPAAAAPIRAAAPAEPRPEPAPEGGDPVRERVLGIVGDKTGYPRDMLDLDLDLEADLGIDTVKQAETFAAIREAYQIPRDDALRLRDYPTLAHAIRFVKERRPDLAETAPAPAPAPEPPTATERASVPETEADADAPRSDLEAARRIPRRVPRAVLRPARERCEPTGVELGGTSRVLVVMDQGGVGRALVRRLEKLGVRTETVEDAPDRETLAGRLEAWSREGPFQGVYWLPALDAEGDLRELEPAQWRAALHLRVKLLHETMRALGETIGPSGTFLVAATRLGGRHGYEATGAVAPLGGAVTGFAKAFQRERPEALVKAVDFGPSRRTAELADALLAETRRDPGAVEVGVRDGLRWSVGLVEEPLADEAAGLALGRESVFLVTGAAGSIVSAITADLAAASGGTFHLLDLVPEPRADDADLVRFAHDRDGLQRELFERLKARGERATPARVERELARLERAQACLAAIQAVRRAGGTAHYHQVDLTDAEAVAKLADDVRARHERVDVLLHAAGLERSRRLQDKDAGEFDLIFDVKADGWFNLVHALGELPLGAVVAFSSIAGRFGNAGQTDYSAANDLLCKCVSSLRRTRPETQALAIDWTAWARIGMASRGSIPQVMERVGIDMLAPEAGIPIVGRELRGGTRGEVLIGERLGFLLQDRDERGGLDASVLAPGAESPLLGRVLRMGPESGLCVETRLDPAAQPFLDHHRIDGTPVLPGVMGIEAFAELAAWAAPGWQVRGLEEVAFLAPFKFYRDEPRILELNARLEPDGDEILAHCRLAGRRELPGRGEPQRTTHFTARVRLARTLLGAESGSPAPKPRPDAARADAVYRVYFHGPAYRVLERAWGADGTAFGRLAAALPDDHHPADTPLRTLPRLVELCFQTAGIWEIGTHGRMALPRGIGRLSFPGRPAASAPPLHAVVRAGPEGSGFEAEVVDAAGAVWVRLEGYATAALPAGVDGELRAPLAAAMR